MKKQARKPTAASNVRMAAKTLSSSRASAKTKSDAGKVLARHAENIRKIQPAPKVGSISRSAARNAARTVLGKKK